MIRRNLARLLEQIETAAQRSKRNSEDIRLLAVSKRMPVKAIMEANQCGQILFGENYLQEASDKISRLPSSLQWHFIGHLQSNKAKKAAELFQVIETVDRLKIARLLNKYAGEYQKQLDILIQVNIGEEQQKSGIVPKNAFELLRGCIQFKNLRVRGLMTIPPVCKTQDESRHWFRELKRLSIDLAQKNMFYDNTSIELSMGMSGDFIVAIEEGATLVRVGTALFGPRPILKENT